MERIFPNYLNQHLNVQITDANVSGDNYLTQIAQNQIIKEYGQEDFQMINFAQSIKDISIKQQQDLDILATANKIYFDDIGTANKCSATFQSLVFSFRDSVAAYSLQSKEKYQIMDKFQTLNQETKKLLKIKVHQRCDSDFSDHSFKIAEDYKNDSEDLYTITSLAWKGLFYLHSTFLTLIPLPKL